MAASLTGRGGGGIVISTVHKLEIVPLITNIIGGYCFCLSTARVQNSFGSDKFVLLNF